MIEKRLIDANALEADCNIFNAWDAQIVKAWLDDQPTVDAVEVVHGRWIEINQRKDVEGWIECDYKCSVCKEVSWEEGNYCPNCGARMDGEKSDE